MSLNINQHISEFSPDGKLYATINQHGVLQIFDTETSQLKQEYTPNLHLASPCTCLTWIHVNSAANGSEKKFKKRKSLPETEKSSVTLYLAFGTSKGGVALYSYATGKLERNLNGEGHTGRVTAIANDGADTIFTCGEDFKVIVWSLSNEKQVQDCPIAKEKPHSIVYLRESSSVLIGARQIKRYSLERQKCLQTFTGHTSDVLLLKTFVFNDEEYAVSASRLERVLCVWKLKKENKDEKITNALSTFRMEDIAYGVSCIIDEHSLKVATVLRNGILHFYCELIETLQPEKLIKPLVTIEIASNTTGNSVVPIPVAAASIEYAKETDNILFGYGEKQFLRFENISSKFNEKRVILERNDPKKIFTKKEQKENNLKLLTPLISDKDVEYQTSIVQPRKVSKIVEIPMETRLENLSINKGEQPQAQSKVQLLIQGLHSKDSELLRTVLSTNDEKIIQLTLQKLPVQYISSLVEELTKLMQKKRAHVQVAASWFTILIRTHASQLMALNSTELLNRFGTCLGVIEHRQKCLEDISKLSGRLDLLVSQIKRNNTEEASFSNENVLIFEDEDSSNSEIEDQNVQSDMSEEWSEADEAIDDDEEMDVSEKED